MKYFISRSLVSLFLLFSLSHLTAQVGQNTEILNPNRDSEDKLKMVEGITAEIADAVKDNRPFLNMLAFDKFLAEHLDEGTRTSVYSKIFIPLNLNTASRDEILLVPNLGNKMAHEFEEYRPYVKIAQFRREMGKYVDDAEVARLEQFVFVPIELNTASKEDILSIPGVGDRMLHEFEEYRPYKSMEQFHREIGKYVDDKELARLARYVYLK